MRGDIIFDDGRSGSRFKDTRKNFSRNIEETVGGDWRGGYRYPTSHFFSHNLGDHGILLHMSGASCNFDDSLHEYGRCYSRGDGARRGIRSQ